MLLRGDLDLFFVPSPPCFLGTLSITHEADCLGGVVALRGELLLALVAALLRFLLADAPSDSLGEVVTLLIDLVLPFDESLIVFLVEPSSEEGPAASFGAVVALRGDLLVLVFNLS